MSTITQQDIDRLVDDELSPAERSELLTALEAAPDGWRRCALAYVEAQSLRRELCGLTAAVPPIPSTLVEKKHPILRRAASGWVAIAVSLLLAFGLGSFTRGGFSTDPLVEQVAESPVPPPTETTLEPSPEAALVQNRQPADSPNADVITFWTKDEQGNRHSLRTRLVDAAEIQQQLGVEVPSSAPPVLQRRFEQRGLQLESRRRYAPLHMENGRTLVVPVEDMRVAPLPVKYL